MQEYQEIIQALADLRESHEIVRTMTQPDILILMGVCLGLYIFSNSTGSKSQRTNAFFAEKITIYNLSRQAVKQLKQRKVDRVCLYSGSFKNWQINPVVLWVYVFILGRPPSLFVPTANPGVEIIGAPGMGKTLSIIDRLVVSAIEQKFPILLYDYKGSEYGGKGGQIPVIGGCAARHGYKLRIFAPGRDYTCTINLLGFLRDCRDIAMAEAIAEILHESIKEETGKSDNFFGPAGRRLLYSSFLFAKNTQYPDLAMAFAVLQLPELGKRLRYARKKSNPALTIWNYITFSQYMSFAQAGETSEGILGGAQQIATKFIQPDLLPCILGATNISLDLDAKEILVFQSDESRREVYNPIIAATTNIAMKRNFSYQRKIPLVLSLDEYATLSKIKESVHWANWHRSKGLALLIGYQNESQVASVYGKHGVNILRTGLKNKFLFNPLDEETEAKWSKTLGEKEVTIKSKSRSYGGGKGSSKNLSEQQVLTPLLRRDDIHSFPVGAAVYTNPELKKGKRGNIPWMLDRVRVSSHDLRLKEKSEQLWFDKALPALRNYERQRRPKLDLELELEKRLELAEELLPLPSQEENNSDFDTTAMYDL